MKFINSNEIISYSINGFECIMVQEISTLSDRHIGKDCIYIINK